MSRRWLLGVLLLPGIAQAGIHASLSSDGRLLVSGCPTPGSLEFHPHARPGRQPLRTAGTVLRVPGAELQRLFHTVAQETGVDVRLLQAVALQESGFDPHARSPVGAVGLMQLMPGTAHRFGVTDRHDALQNLRGGAAYLRWLLGRFDHDVRLALAAYNAGEGAVMRHGKRVPPFPQTHAYVEAVLAAYARTHSGIPEEST